MGLILENKKRNILITKDQIAETIIVGKIPNTAIQLYLNGTGFKLGN